MSSNLSIPRFPKGVICLGDRLSGPIPDCGGVAGSQGRK